jgi:hypothetical protein
MENINNELEELRRKNQELEEKLKSYTNTNSHKKYYEKNKEIIKERSKKFMRKVKEDDPAKLKEWRHNAYIKRKERIKKEQIAE